MCPPTAGDTAVEANIECLALGWEITCAPDQNRCYSENEVETTKVEKGCTRSDDCLGSTSCCQTSFCNADPQSSKTGHGNTCTSAENCIQGDTTMVCDREEPRDLTKVCLCRSDSYKRGATCKMKSYPDELCTVTAHCYDFNTTCVQGRCRCPTNMFANGTRCVYQRPFGEVCLAAKECRGRNTDCIDSHCSCAFGYLVVNGTNSCSGTARAEVTSPVVLTTLLTAASVLRR